VHARGLNGLFHHVSVPWQAMMLSWATYPLRVGCTLMIQQLLRFEVAAGLMWSLPLMVLCLRTLVLCQV